MNWMGKIRDRLSSRKDFFGHHANLQRAIIGVVYFFLFTVILSAGLFVSKLDLVVGEPSPQLITAPRDKDIEDLEKYELDQEAAARAVQPVYKPDEVYLGQFTNGLEAAITALRDAAASGGDENALTAELQQNQPFSVLTEGTVISLLRISPDSFAVFQQLGADIILNRARNGDTGARTEADVASLLEEIKADIGKSVLPEDVKLFFAAYVEQNVTRPTLTVDEESTERLRAAAREGVKKEIIHYKANQKIVGAGEIVDAKIYRILEDYGLINTGNTWRSVAGIAMIVLIGIAAIWLYILRYKRDLLPMSNRPVLIGLTMLLVLALGQGIISANLGGSEFNALAGTLVPVAWATMTIAILIGVDVALLVAVVLAIYVAMLVDPALTGAFGMQTGIVALFGGVVGVYSVSHLSQRSDLARAGLFVAGVNIVMVSAIALTTNMRLTVWLVGLLLGIINGVVSSFLTVGALHWFESGFKITSSVRLLELSNPNRPLLKRLLMEAPGTYHHSVMVGNLAEAAAEAVQADATLVRVGALYHDIGKLKRPYFFIENQFTQENPHDKIAPTLSSLIITSHVKDGVELAKKHKLPQPVLDIIDQHHGDGLVTFFYYKALEENEDTPEEAFHYDGQKPQTKEATLVALADSVEAAVRSMKQPTPGRVEGLVRKIIKDRLNDGQLDQCDLTFQDLDRIAMAFVRVLSGIFHSRVEYPDMPAHMREQAAPKRLVEDVTKQNVRIQADPVKSPANGDEAKNDETKSNKAGNNGNKSNEAGNNEVKNNDEAESQVPQDK